MNLLVPQRGWVLVFVGSVVGGLFATFAFSLSLFSIPTLMVKRRAALAALWVSFATTMQNLRPCLA